MTTKTKNDSGTLAAMVAFKSITDQGFGLIVHGKPELFFFSFFLSYPDQIRIREKKIW